MSTQEVTYLSEAARNARALELERGLRRTVDQSFTPADANRNPTFKERMEELARLKGCSLFSLYQEFGVPPSGDLRRQFGIFAASSAIDERKTYRPPVTRQRTYAPSAEAQAIIDAVHAKKNGDETPVPDGVVISGKIAEELARSALELVNNPSRVQAKPARALYSNGAILGNGPKEKPKHPKPTYTAGQTAEEKRLWDEVTSRANARPAPKPAVRTKRLTTEKPGKSLAHARAEKKAAAVPVHTVKKPKETTRVGLQNDGPGREKNRARFDEKILALIRAGKRPPDMLAELGWKEKSAMQLLRMRLRALGMGSAKDRMKEQLAHQPKIGELISQLEKKGAEKTWGNFYTDELLETIETLKALYEISDNEIADGILKCSSGGLKTQLSRYRSETTHGASGIRESETVEAIVSEFPVAAPKPAAVAETLSMETVVKEMLDEDSALSSARIREFARFVIEEAEKDS